MSYILDALKKSEQDRQAAQQPSFMADQLIHKPKKHNSVWPYLVIALLLINFATLFYFFGLKRNDKAVTESAAETIAVEASTPHKANDTPIQESEPLPEPIVAPQKSVTISEPEQTVYRSPEPVAMTRIKPQFIDESDTQINIDANQDQSAASFEEEATLIRPRGFEPISLQEQGDTVFPDVSAPDQEISDSQSDSERADGDVIIAPDSETLSQQSETIWEPVEEEASYPHISDFDDSFQKTIPSMKFNSHIYSDEPTARRVMINNIFLREGDQFQGLYLSQIRETDIILEKNGAEFKLNILRDWYPPR